MYNDYRNSGAHSSATLVGISIRILFAILELLRNAPNTSPVKLCWWENGDITGTRDMTGSPAFTSVVITKKQQF